MLAVLSCEPIGVHESAHTIQSQDCVGSANFAIYCLVR